MMAAAMCGTMPIVHPNAATTLARDPRERPAASVNRTPVPGETMTMNEVTRNSTLTINVLSSMALAVLALEMAARLDGVVRRRLLLLQLGDPLGIGRLAAAGLAVETVDEAGI